LGGVCTWGDAVYADGDVFEGEFGAEELCEVGGGGFGGVVGELGG